MISLRKKYSVVILGGGFAGLRAVHQIRNKLRGSDVEIYLIDERAASLQKPTLPEVAMTGKAVEHTHIKLQPLLNQRQVNYIHSPVLEIKPRENLVMLGDGRAVPYDYLLIALGAKKDFDAISGYKEFGYSICNDTEAPKLWSALQNFRGGPIIVGSSKNSWGTKLEFHPLATACEGPVGEVMFMVDHFLREKNLRERASITAFSPSEVFFEDVGPKVHSKVDPLVPKHGINVVTSKSITRIEKDSVVFADGSSLDSALSIVIPPYVGNDVAKNSGLGDEVGFIPTDESMRHLSYNNIFAAGDSACLAMPKLGHLGIMQADIAVSAMIHDMAGAGEIPEYRPEIFCIMNRGGNDATLIISDYLYGGKTDVAMNGSIPHFMKRGFDYYYYHSRGRMPPEIFQRAIMGLLTAFN